MGWTLRIKRASPLISDVRNMKKLSLVYVSLIFILLFTLVTALGSFYYSKIFLDTAHGDKYEEITNIIATNQDKEKLRKIALQLQNDLRDSHKDYAILLDNFGGILLAILPFCLIALFFLHRARISNK